jgi:hypothetical protein
MADYVLVQDREDHARRFGGRGEFSGNSGLYNKATGFEMDRPQRDGLCAPFCLRDIDEHIGPNGKWITSRSQQRPAMKESGTVIWEKLKSRPEAGLRDRRIAKAQGKRQGEAGEMILEKKKRAYKAAGIEWKD